MDKTLWEPEKRVGSQLYGIVFAEGIVFDRGLEFYPCNFPVSVI